MKKAIRPAISKWRQTEPDRGTDQIAVKIQHKNRLLTDPGAIEDVLAVENDVVPFDRADVLERPRGTI